MGDDGNRQGSGWVELSTLTFEQVLSAVGEGLALDDVGPLTGRPALFVDVGGVPADDLERSKEALAGLPCVLIGVDEGSSAHGDEQATSKLGGIFDVLVCGADKVPRPWVGAGDQLGAWLARLRREIAGHPAAALVLAQVLRMSDRRMSDRADLVDSLAVESFAYATLQAGDDHRRWLQDRVVPAEKAVVGEPVVVSLDGGTLRLVLNRAESRNPFSAEMRDRIIEGLQIALVDQRVERVIISGLGPVFCSGGDLREFGTTPDPTTAHTVRSLRSAGRWMAECAERARVEVVVHGLCIGAGIEVPAFADWITATPGTEFRLPEVSMGLIPGAGGTYSLVRRMGRHRTAFMCLSGINIGCEMALGWHLIDEIEG